MKKLLAALLLAVVGFGAGCTVVESPREHYRRLAQQRELQGRMLVEDLDYILLLDRSSSLSQWHAHIGY